MSPSKKQEINDDAITDYFRRLNESMDAHNREYEAKLASTDVKHELDKIKSSLDKMFTTESYDDDMLKLVIERAIEHHVAAHFEIKDVFNLESEIPYDKFLHKDSRLGNETMFMDWFVPVTINSERYILASISGQGETFIVIRNMREYAGDVLNDHNDLGFSAISRWYSLSSIFNNI